MKAVDVAGNELETVLSQRALQTELASAGVLCEIAMAAPGESIHLLNASGALTLTLTAW